ncbi:SLOG family protein [Aquibacillus salsiterrae]|uniref:SLOG family protein n=1 Tax=Aquibacillus salsiterrae TaxID=2950439 RepID=A0A9X3WCE5_9BACI|nr:SLOG family protein [Aquibacillus salsiterrae]MDC3415335.1 SLOG family protein [Aquibacillus salsiterrae]
MRIVTVTGYKPIEMNIYNPNDKKIAFIKAAIRKKIISLIDDGLEWVLVSGQMGVELWTVEVILDLKDEYDIKVGVVPPFEGQETRWPEHYQNVFQEISLVVDFFQCLYSGEYKGPFQFKARDKWLINKSDGCLLLIDEENPGSIRFFLEEAQAESSRSEYPILTITPFDLEEIVQEFIDQNITNYEDD